MSFCNYKAYYLIEPNMRGITRALINGSIFEIILNKDLPEGWELQGIGSSGLGGIVITFDVDTGSPPTKKEENSIREHLIELEKSIK